MKINPFLILALTACLALPGAAPMQPQVAPPPPGGDVDDDGVLPKIELAAYELVLFPETAMEVNGTLWLGQGLALVTIGSRSVLGPDTLGNLGGADWSATVGTSGCVTYLNPLSGLWEQYPTTVYGHSEGGISGAVAAWKAEINLMASEGYLFTPGPCGQ